MAQCQVQVPASFFRPTRTEILNLQMVCRPELLTKYPGSELVTKNSYRLQWFIDGIKERGQITRGTFPYDLDPRKTTNAITALLPKPLMFFFEAPFLTYQTHLLVNFKASFETDEKFEALYSLSINLTNGEIATNLINELVAVKLLIRPPQSKMLEKRKIAYRDGFTALFNHLQWLLQVHDCEWIKNAATRFEAEAKYLEQFYQGSSTENKDKSSFYRNMAETYRKFQPQIRIKIINAGIFYLPLVLYTVESHDPKLKIPPLVYDPVRRKLKSPSFNQDRQNDIE